MNKIFKVAAILFLPILVELISSCCDCPETISLDYTNCSMTVSNLDNSGPEPVVTLSEGVSGLRDKDRCQQKWEPVPGKPNQTITLPFSPCH